MTDPRLTVAAEALAAYDADPGSTYCEQHGRSALFCSDAQAAVAVAALDAYDDAHPLEALAAYRERVERDVRAAVAAEIQAACVTLGCNAAPCTCDAAVHIAQGDA